MRQHHRYLWARVAFAASWLLPGWVVSPAPASLLVWPCLQSTKGWVGGLVCADAAALCWLGRGRRPSLLLLLLQPSYVTRVVCPRTAQAAPMHAEAHGLTWWCCRVALSPVLLLLSMEFVVLLPNNPGSLLQTPERLEEPIRCLLEPSPAAEWRRVQQNKCRAIGSGHEALERRRWC